MAESEKNDSVRVRRLLAELGVPRSSTGFSVCEDTVLMAMEVEEVYGSLSKVIFPEIAGKRGKSVAAVEKSVRDMVGKSWERGDRDKFRAVLGDNYSSRRGKPTVIEFVTAVVDYLDLAG